MEEKLLFIMELLLRHNNKLNTTSEEDKKLETYISELEYETDSDDECENDSDDECENESNEEEE